uniref:Cytochrome P450 704C1 n=1 Tax=Ananas comosus var. bracteatus TaxID=296719 RepID=A0A6V7PXH5_ANACO|nr:unnamed protein product [Ananas comosus var. bracteatus]
MGSAAKSAPRRRDQEKVSAGSRHGVPPALSRAPTSRLPHAAVPPAQDVPAARARPQPDLHLRPRVVEHILKTNFDNYGKGSYNYINSKELFGDGIFAVDGDKWRQQRKLASFEFSTKVLRDFSGVIFKKNAAKLAHIISQKAETNQSMEIQDLFMKSTMDSIFSIGFGLELDCLNGSNYEGSNFAKAFDDSVSSFCCATLIPFGDDEVLQLGL